MCFVGIIRSLSQILLFLYGLGKELVFRYRHLNEVALLNLIVPRIFLHLERYVSHSFVWRSCGKLILIHGRLRQLVRLALLEGHV